METTDNKREYAIQRRIYQTLLSLDLLPKVSVEKTYDPNINCITRIQIKHTQEYVPNLLLEWCGAKKHYRVYIHIASIQFNKTSAGYCICTVGSSLTASGLVMFYSFLHKNRANNKSEARE